MNTGKAYPSETSEFKDPVSGVRVRRLTNYKGNSHHLYFTNPGWYDGGRRLLFSSDRNNRTNLFSLELASGGIRQLTDLNPLSQGREFDFLRAFLNPGRDEVYFVYGRTLMGLNLISLQSRPLYEVPKGFEYSSISCTADGTSVCVGIYEDLSDRIHLDLLRGYIGFAELSAARPLSRIVRVGLDKSENEILWEEKYWIGHVNTSSTQPDLLTFCHEGPWKNVDHRIWGLNIQTKKAWKVRDAYHEEIVGHEYWYADGLRLGYHGMRSDGSYFIGHIRHDNSDCVEADFSAASGHTHSNDETLIVGDGGSVIRLWRWNGHFYDGPHVLCEHNTSMKVQQVHAHPRFTPDGRQVLFTSDVSGYGNIYIADVPGFDSLPEPKE